MMEYSEDDPACPSLADILHNTALLLHFVEFAKDNGEPKLAAAAYAASLIQSWKGAQDRILSNELKLKMDELFEALDDIFDLYGVSPLGWASFRYSTLRLPPSVKVQQKLREYADISGPHVGPEHEMYAFALSVIYGMRVSMEMQDRFDAALAPHQSIDQFLEQDGVDAKYESDAVARSLLYCCGSSFDVSAIQSNIVRRFKVPNADVRFTFEDAAPGIFHRLRVLADVNREQYMHSLLREDVELIKFGTNSKSGEFFFFSHDGLFMIKTVSEKCAQRLIAMLPLYEEHLHRYPESLLCRYLGLHRITLDVQLRTDEDVFPERWFIVMRSSFYTSLEIHEKYDLKGSTWGRWAAEADIEKGCPLLDLDWKSGASKFYPLKFSQEDQDAILSQYSADTALLQSFDLVDYSILMGIHDTRHDYMSDPTSPSLHQTCSVTLSGESTPSSVRRVISRGGNKVPGGVKSKDGSLVVIFCLIDTLEPYDLERQVQHSVGGALTGLISAFGMPCEQAIVDPASYRERQALLFRDILCGKCSDVVENDTSSWFF